ncbi:MAG: universal stress protein [Blastocatellia bacterium]|nr:universal stress protein [Blastocatellia bacterium]
MKIENILVPTDFSENAQRAFEKACSMARQLGATLHVLHVRDESALRTAVKEGLLGADSTDEELQRAVEQLIEQRFSSVCAGLDRAGLPLKQVSRRGDPKAVIVDYAEEIAADIIVMGTHGTGLMEKIRSAMMGAIAESVIRKSPCPVLLVRVDHE